LAKIKIYKLKIQVIIFIISDNYNPDTKIIKYKQNNGKIKYKYTIIRSNIYNANKKFIDLFLNLNPNYYDGDCISVLVELTYRDHIKVKSKYLYNSKL
jgi:hypothetical protein